MVLSALVIDAVRIGKVQPDDHRERTFKEHSLLGSGPIQANRRDGRGTLESGRRIWKGKLCLEPCDLMYIVRSAFGAMASIQTRSRGARFLAYTVPCRCPRNRAWNAPNRT